MSRSHLQIKRVPDKPRPRLGFAAIFAAVLGILTCAILTLWYWPHDSLLTSRGIILETRIVPLSQVNSLFGGHMNFQLVAHVSYDQDGVPQDRWIDVDTVSPSHELIEAQTAKHPNNCIVYWKPGHPEGARCRLPN